ncbi:MAG TPA: tail fiber domain-containing protein [Thermoanaerobaculia bacterium]|nr:tail fiber domain-containing protein [Thermoanaerobaculia bacterium]
MTRLSHSNIKLYAMLAFAASLAAGAAAAQDALYIDSSGRVGIGTNNPGGDLHIFGGATEDVFNAIGPNATSNAFNFGYSGASFGSGSGFFNVRPAAGAVAPNPALFFMTANVPRMILDNEGFLGVHTSGVFNPAHPIHAQASGARLTTGGVWTNASSRELKENIRPLDLDRALAALQGLQAVEFNYKVEADDPQVGFIAEDVPDLVATPDRKSLAPTDIVGVLTRVVQEQQRKIEELTVRLESLQRQ